MAELARAVLWIDDQCDQRSILLLKFGGFAVDCATTASAGLRMAEARPYDGIILEQRLPDGSGLDVLERLRCAGVRTPVMLLTGIADIKSAVAAMQLGASDYKEKPIIGVEWIESVRALTNSPIGAHSATESSPPRRPSSDCGCLEPFATALNTAAKELSEQDVEEARKTVILALARRVSSPAIGISEFVASAEVLRQFLTVSRNCAAAEFLARAEPFLATMPLRVRMVEHGPVATACDCIAAALLKGHRPLVESIAQQMGASVFDLERSFELLTGNDFNYWRRVLAVKLGVQRIVASAEQVSQIAYSLGYEHHSQFDREFTRILGVSPTTFRRLNELTS